MPQDAPQKSRLGKRGKRETLEEGSEMKKAAGGTDIYGS
jgi:hypothetical protein